MKRMSASLVVFGLVASALAVAQRTAPRREASAASGTQRGSTVSGTTARAVTAAQAFLAALTPELRARAQLTLRPEIRSIWSNLPTGVVMQVGAKERNGVKLGELNAAQQQAALALVAATLSPSGYEKALDIVTADELLEQTSAPTRAPASAVRFGRAEYYVAILGQPSATGLWMVQFGGHHLALNVTLAGSANVLTPSHVGTQPAVYTFEGRTVRPLGDELDKALALMNTLTMDQQKLATLNYRVADTVLAAGQDGKVIQPEGIRASGLTAAQQAMLLDLAGEWVGIMDDSQASLKMVEIKANMSGTWFAWSGPVTREGGAYFRLQGPTVVIEYAPQASRDANGLPNHIHTIYRDPTNDYGAKLAGR
jgi:hypothetical protein